VIKTRIKKSLFIIFFIALIIGIISIHNSQGKQDSAMVIELELY